MTEEEVDLEFEKTKSYRLGQIDKLEDIAEELRQEAGDVYAHADHPDDVRIAKRLKSMARDFEQRAEEKREEWKEWREEYQ